MKNTLTRKLLSLAVLLAMLVSSCAGLAETASEPAELRLIFYGDMTLRREEYFKNEFHDRILEELNIDLSVETISWGNYDVVATMLASGEDFAVYNILSMFDWQSKGYLAPITMEQIETLMPDYLDMRTPAKTFDCVTVGGQVYCIPIGNKAMSGHLATIAVRNDILKSVGHEASEIDTVEELYAAFDAVQAAYPDMRIMTSWPAVVAPSFSWTFEERAFYVSSADPPFAAVNELEEGDQVYNFYETDYYAQLCYMAQEWQEKGYIDEDLIVNPTQPLADWNAGNCLAMYGSPSALVDTGLSAKVPGAEVTLIELGDIPKFSRNNYDWGISISAESEEKVEDWLRLINWIYASKENYEFCIYGVEGKDWERAEDGSYNRLVTDTFWDGWFLQASKYHQFDPSLTQEQIDAYVTYDDNSLPSKLAGFIFDTTNVAAEVAALMAVYDEYLQPMGYGLLDYDENIEEVRQRLKNAGIDAYMAEFQRQVTEFINNK